MKKSKLRVWWIPQIPMKGFHVPVMTITEAMLILDTLARYDIFQYENKIKPDYSNAGGLEVLEDGEWSEWYNDEGQDIDEVMDELWTNSGCNSRIISNTYKKNKKI